MKSNESLQKDVQDAIKWEPLLHAAEIGVIAKAFVLLLFAGVFNHYKFIGFCPLYKLFGIWSWQSVGK